MSFSEIEIMRLQKIVGAFIEERRPPPHIRPKLDLGFRLQGIELFEVRPAYNDPKDFFCQGDVRPDKENKEASLGVPRAQEAFEQLLAADNALAIQLLAQAHDSGKVKITRK